jgi:hypothetical protein
MPAKTTKASKNGKGGAASKKAAAAALDNAAHVDEVEESGSDKEEAEEGTRIASWDGPPTKKRHNGDTYRPSPPMPVHTNLNK